MMEILLLYALKSFAKHVFSDHMSGSPKVHLAFLPTKTAENREESEFPYIIIRPVKGEGSKITIKLLFGRKSEDDDGFMDVLNDIGRFRTAIQKQPVLDRKFCFDEPFEWQFFENQPFPEWIAEVTTVWTVPEVLEEVQI